MSAQLNDWRDIHFAYQVAKLGTLSAAAAALEVHHSTVLRHIDHLEQRLNTRLFHRHARGYTPTDAGRLLFEVAGQTQEGFDRLMGQLEGADQQLRGTLVLTSVGSFSRLLTPILAAFQRLHPEIRLEFVADQRIFKLEYGEAHVSIRAGAQPRDPDNIVQHLYRQRTTLFASPRYVQAHGGMNTLEDIQQHRFIGSVLPLTNIPFMKWLAERVPTEQIYYRASNFSSMQWAVEEGMGIAPLNCWVGHQNPRLVPLLLPPDAWQTDLWLVTHRDIHRTQKVQAFTQFLKQQIGQLPTLELSPGFSTSSSQSGQK